METKSNRSLPDGYHLLDYTIDSVLSYGGFSFVYLAHDQNGKLVAIKEYLPVSLALRVDGDQVEPCSDDNLTRFRHGMKCFFEEGRTLAKLDHPNILRVLNFFRANNTAYMVMQYESGKSLQDYIQAHDTPMPEHRLRRLFSELLNGLREVHTLKLLHLDIKPANIHIRSNGSPVLLDFGSARQTLTEIHSTLAHSYTPGFAAPEIYFNRKALLGPWTDIYSVGATLYACLTRTSPPAADKRRKQDTLVPAARIGKGIYSAQLLEIIDWCMRLDYLERPQSVFTLQKALKERIPEKPSLLNTIKKKLSLMRAL